jgi:hypothetical protein
MPLNIYEYIDYKKFLSDWRKAEKQRNPGLTHEYLCHALGQKTAPISMILRWGGNVLVRKYLRE